jgi:hypothetical protein
MHPRISLIVLSFFLLVLNSGFADAAWSEPVEIINGGWGAGKGQFGLRSEGGFSVVPSIESVTSEKQVIISDPVNRKQMVFNNKGVLLDELKWSDAKGQEGRSLVPLSQRNREAIQVQSMKVGAATYRVTIVFPDKNVVVDSEEDFTIAARDAAGFVYGISAETVIRFDKTGKKTDALPLPSSHEELITVPGRRAPRGVYIMYGDPVIAPNGDVYAWQKSEAKYSILKWTWQ